MRQVTKFDVLLHKVRINTDCYKYWQLPRAEKVARQLEYNKSVCKYRKQCIVKYPGITHDFTGEYDVYINKGMSPYEAWHTVMTEFAWK